jgi:c-di-GMP phosphodiesterase
MTSLFQRLLSGFFGGKDPAPAKSPASGQAHKAITPAPVATSTVVHPPAAGSTLSSIGARRPLISGKGDIVGFEFHISADMQRRLSRRADSSACAAYAMAVLASAQVLAQSGRIGLARLPASYLIHAIGPDSLAGLWIAIDPPENTTPQSRLSPVQLQVMGMTLQDLRAKGAKIAWDARHRLPMNPDFVLLAQGSQPMANVLQRLQTLPSAWQGLPTLVTDIATFDDLELALHQHVSYVCGSLAATTTACPPRGSLPVSPGAARIGHLLNLLVTEAENDVIVDNIKSDIGLSYRLLQRINSASFALTNAGASIDQAVLLLGRSELYRWVSLLLFQFADKRKASSALQEVALWRSRLLELLAQANHEAVPAQLFTLGLASMMGPILGISLRDVLSILPLHPLAQQALLEHSGPWHLYLQVALRVEAHGIDSHDDDDDPLLRPFGGATRITALSDMAWDWAWQARHPVELTGP